LLGLVKIRHLFTQLLLGLAPFLDHSHLTAHTRASDQIMQGLKREKNKGIGSVLFGATPDDKLGTDKGNLTLLKCVTINTKE
jgi:hypothetical protein